jgi:rod shape-determining protein MreC
MWRRTARDRLFIGFLVLATVTVLTLDFRTGVLDGVSSTTSSIFGTLQAGVRGFVRPFESVVQSIRDLGSLRKENEKLREENLDLRRRADTYPDLARENTRIHSLLELEHSAGLEAVHARVIGASISGLERSATINKGRSSGVGRDRAVIAPEGLVGHITWAGGNTAKVLLLTDAQSAVGVRIGESGETGLVRGTGDPRVLRLELVERSALDQGAVKPGDVVLTSGYEGGIYPEGLPVGRVESVNLARRGGPDYTILVRPFVRFSQLDIVGVTLSSTEVIEAPPTPTPRPES